MKDPGEISNHPDCQTLRVGELRAYLEQFPADAPVIAYVASDGDRVQWSEYTNFTEASAQHTDEYPIVVLAATEVTDNRGW